MQQYTTSKNLSHTSYLFLEEADFLIIKFEQIFVP